MKNTSECMIVGMAFIKLNLITIFSFIIANVLPIMNTHACCFHYSDEISLIHQNSSCTVKKITKCGKYRIILSTLDRPALRCKETSLSVETKTGNRIFHIIQKTASPVSINPLWCVGLIGNGSISLAFTIFSGGAHCCWKAFVILLGDPPKTLLEVDLGNYFDLSFKQLDSTQHLELLTKSDIFAYFGGLPSYVTPFLPVVYAFDGNKYLEMTVRFPEVIKADLDQALKDLNGSRLEQKVGKALRALGDFVLLGDYEPGIIELKARVSDDVARWLDKHADKAFNRIKNNYRELSDNIYKNIVAKPQ